MGSPLLTPKEAAEFLAVSVRTLHRWCRQGRIAYVSLNGRGDRRFTRDALEEFVERETVKPPRAVAVDKTRPQPVACPPKGGVKPKSVGVEGSDLKERIRAL